MMATGIVYNGREVAWAWLGCNTCKELMRTDDGEQILRWAATHCTPYWWPSFVPRPPARRR